MYMSKRTRGAVSVFLVIILVPCMLVSSLFVDLGRVFLSKSMANSAGDLALNSLLTHYDSLLKDWYGMAVSCQSIDKFYKESGEFFLDMMKSQDLTDAQLATIVNEVTYGSDNKEIADLLQMECLGDASGLVSPVKGSSLADAAMMKSEIVEFMKYRAPIEMTESIIERIRDDDSVKDAHDAEPDKPLSDAKQAYGEALSDLIKYSYNTYWAIRDFCPIEKSPEISNELIRDYEPQLEDYREIYYCMNKTAIACLVNTQGLKQYKRLTIPLNEYTDTYTYQHSDVYSEHNGDSYIINGDRITQLLDDLGAKIDDFFEEKDDNFVKAVKNSDLMNNLPAGTTFDIGDLEANNTAVNPIQWWVRMDEIADSHTPALVDAAEEMLKAYAKVCAIDGCTIGDDAPLRWATRAADLKDRVKEAQEKYLTENKVDANDDYLRIVNKLETVSKNNLRRIDADNYSFSPENRTFAAVNMSAAPGVISTALNNIKTLMQNKVLLLNRIINGGFNNIPTKVILPLDALADYAAEVKNKLQSWKNEAEKSTTDMGEKDRDEIEHEIEEKLSANITKPKVIELKKRLQNIKEQLESVITKIDAIMYNAVKIADIKSINDFLARVNSGNFINPHEIPLKNNEIFNYAHDKFSRMFVPNADLTKPFVKWSHLDDDNYNPVIYPVDQDGEVFHEYSGKVKTPELYSFLHEQFRSKPRNTVEDKEKEAEDGKAAGADKETEAKEKGRYHGGGGNIPHDFSAADKFGLINDSFDGVTNLFTSLIHLDIGNIIDDLYATSYIMNMFSYATYKVEGLYNLCPNKDSLKLKPPGKDGGYYPRAYDGYIGSPNADKESNKGKWLSTDLKDAYNKSLTNKMINLENNLGYEAEVEYILFGGADNNDNVRAAYSKIFVIRLALNSVSGYANFWDNIAVNTAASAIQAATGGIIPAFVTKIVLIPILAAFETAIDLNKLEAGFPVPLYKRGADDWTIKLPEASNGIAGFVELLNGKNGDNEPNPKKGLFYSDYLTAFVYMGLNGRDSVEAAMYQRVAEVIQANMRKISKKDNYTMKKAQVYFQLNAEIRVKPLMLSLPLFNGDEYENNPAESTDWRTYKIRVVRGY